MVMATTIFAPEDMPSTKGPAMGFPKKFCSKNPDSDSAPPSMAAINMRGMRIFHMMEYWVESCPRPTSMPSSSPKGICTLPITMLSTVIPISAASSSMNTSVYRLLRRTFALTIALSLNSTAPPSICSLYKETSVPVYRG